MSGRRAVVIGAGATGLAASRILCNSGFHVVCVEKGAEVGGVWVSGTESPIYDDLHTNLPADLMAFGGTAFPTGTPTFPHHSLVKQYLQSLPHRWGIADCIRTCTSVTNMQKVADGSWEVRCERQDGTPSVVHADFVAVCSGHYSVPFRVELSGKEFFTGRIEHSVDFRSPHAYGDECVVVVGAGPSGMEISAALCDGQQSSGGSRKMVASGPRRVVLSSTRCGFSHGVGGVERRGRVTKVGPGRLVCFGDGPSVEADVIILATGYHYHLPFLPSGLVQILNRATFEGDALDASDESVFVGDASSGVSGRCVWPLLRQCICFNDPSVALIGLPWKVVPWPVAEVQVRYAVGVWNGHISIPSIGPAIPSDTHRAHMLGDQQWQYCLDLEEEVFLGRGEASKIADRQISWELMKEVYEDVGLQRSLNLASYRDKAYRSVPLLRVEREKSGV